jgi:hypothetical protein
MTLLAAIASGHADLSEVLMLIAFLIFAFATVLAVMKRSDNGILIPAGLACVALAFLVT